jgi:hypothetical protein
LFSAYNFGVPRYHARYIGQLRLDIALAHDVRPIAAVGRAGPVAVMKKGVNMYARNAHFRVKSLNMAADFSRALENEILPLLRKQEGFKGEITLSNPGNMERISISLWENKSNAEAYDISVYPQVLKILSKVIDGTPKIRIFEAVALNLDCGTLAERKSS